MGVRAAASRRGPQVALAVLAGAVLGGCASRTESALSAGAASPVPEDLEQVVEDAIVATSGVGSADLSWRFQFGPQSFEIEGELDDDGVGRSTGRTDSGGGSVALEVRSDGETAWVTTDAPAFVAELPDGVSWVEAPYDDLLDAGIMEEIEATWDPLLFLHGLRSVREEEGVGAQGDVVRLLQGTVDYDAVYEAASRSEQSRMDVALNLHQGDVVFEAEIGIDDDGRIRTLDYDITFSVPGVDADVPGASIPVRVSLFVRSFEQEVSPPEPPDPGDTIAAADVPGALDQVGSRRDRTTTTTRPPSDEDEDEDAVADEVLDREPPDPLPPDAATAPDALEVTTLIEGRGDPAEAGDTVIVHYVGKTADGDVVDSSWELGQPFPVESLGDAPVIEGWNEGLIGVREGERRRLVMGSDLAYGPTGGGEIPPGAPLAFEIDVVEIVPGS
jgi:peptidylprolyl isomerase